MSTTTITRTFNILVAGYFTIISSCQIVVFPHSQPIFLVLVTMGIALRLFTLQQHQKNIRFLVFSLFSHHLALGILSVVQFYVSIRFRRDIYLEYQLVYAPFLIGIGYVYFNVGRRRA